MTMNLFMQVIDGLAQITVNDTGSGIDPEIMPRLFQKFVTKSEKGTGLGLYISNRIIQAHGGKMWAENNADGKGATFTLRCLSKRSIKKNFKAKWLVAMAELVLLLLFYSNKGRSSLSIIKDHVTRLRLIFKLGACKIKLN